MTNRDEYMRHKTEPAGGQVLMGLAGAMSAGGMWMVAAAQFEGSFVSSPFPQHHLFLIKK